MKSKEDFQEVVRRLSAQYRVGLAEEIERIEDLWLHLKAQGAGAADLRELQRRLHSMAGSGQTFGVHGLSDAAAAAELHLEALADVTALTEASQSLRFEQLLAEVRRAACPG